MNIGSKVPNESRGTCLADTSPMTARTLVVKGVVVLPLVATLSMTLASRRLEDHYHPLAIDRIMDDRLDHYVPLARLTRNALASGSEAAQRDAGEAWMRGIKSGSLLPALPARYGDTGADGPKGELIKDVIRLSSHLVQLAKAAGKMGEGRRATRLYLAAVAPVVAVRGFDLGTMKIMEFQRRRVIIAMRKTGLLETANGCEGRTKIKPDERERLVAHMRVLRTQYRARYPDEEGLMDADPAFEYELRKQARLTAMR